MRIFPEGIQAVAAQADRNLALMVLGFNQASSAANRSQQRIVPRSLPPMQVLQRPEQKENRR